jgi:DNA (cytosine-5)-methyltransferase 1
MNYATVSSGIEAPSVAWHDLGWRPQWFSENAPFPSRVLKHHYPDVPNLGDMLQLENNKIFNESVIDLLAGGTPCQSFSIAGLRGGLADVRGNLSLEFCRILIRKRPSWFLWENVPGVFSSFSDEAADTNGPIWQTADFATLLSAFSECGYSCAWRVLDAQYFGVPQRRRRVFVIGYLGNDWRPPFAVLFERAGLQRDITPQRAQEQNSSGTINACAARSRGAGIDPGMITAETITGNHRGYVDNGTGLNLVADTIQAGYGDKSDRGDGKNLIAGCWWDGGQTSQTLDAVLHKGQTMPEKNRFPAIIQRSMVRRLTPLECERLQGFPDHYTAIPRAADGPRYKAIGNSMAVPVMRWIGFRIDAVDKILSNLQKAE